MASSSSALLPAMRSMSLARLETTPVSENAPISRPQPARMPTSSAKVRPFISRNLTTVRPAPFLAVEQLVEHEQQQRGVERRVALALHHQHHEDEQHDDEHEVPALPEGVATARQFRALQPLQAVARGIGVDLHEQAEVVQQRRDRGRERDLGVAHVEELRHDERGRAHHRRREHRAGGGAGLDGAGVARRESRSSSSPGWSWCPR